MLHADDEEVSMHCMYVLYKSKVRGGSIVHAQGAED